MKAADAGSSLTGNSYLDSRWSGDDEESCVEENASWLESNRSYQDGMHEGVGNGDCS